MTNDYAGQRAWGVELRSVRANRPKFAQKGARAQTFGAGLEQAEQLWRASEVVGPVASPLLLFYGLTQAGRAICAAGAPGRAWQPAESHGLAFEFARPTSGAGLDLTAVVVKAPGTGLIQQVAAVLNSPVLDSAATLSAMLGSLDTNLLFNKSQVAGPRPLEVHEFAKEFRSFDAPATKSLFIGPVPARFAANRELVPAGPQNLEYTRIVPPSGAQIAEWLSAYPTLRALGTPAEVIGPESSIGRVEHGDWVIKLIWDESEPMADVKQSDWTLEQLDEIYAYRPDGTHGVVLPSVAGNSEAQDLLVAWWLVLYCLSMLARYYPKEWTEMLDVDASPLAVPLEHLISAARSSVPALIAFRLRLLGVIQDTSETDVVGRRMLIPASVSSSGS